MQDLQPGENKHGGGGGSPHPSIVVNDVSESGGDDVDGGGGGGGGGGFEGEDGETLSLEEMRRQQQRRSSWCPEEERKKAETAGKQVLLGVTARRWVSHAHTLLASASNNSCLCSAYKWHEQLITFSLGGSYSLEMTLSPIMHFCHKYEILLDHRVLKCTSHYALDLRKQG